MTAKQTVGIDSASATHDAMVAAYNAQRARVSGPQADAWAGCAQSFQADPKRPLDELLTKIASLLRADDTLIDVGGGAGRLSLPLASRCHEVVIVDPSPAMRDGFDTIINASGIGNARFVEATWPRVDGITGDVALVAHVTYFVAKIAPFIEKLNSSIRRRVIVGARSVPPPNQIAGLFRLTHGEDLAPVPGPDELLSVLRDMNIAAELIDVGPAAAPATMTVASTRDDAIRSELESAVKAGWLQEDQFERVRPLADEHFDELFAKTERGFWRHSALEARDLLITWETAGLASRGADLES